MSSAAPTNLAVVPSIDTQLDYKPTIVVTPQSTMFQTLPATGVVTGAPNPSTVPFTFNPAQGTRTFIDRHLLVECPYFVVLQGSGALPPGVTSVFQSGYDAPRAYPLASNTLTTNLTLNNQTYSFASYQIAPWLARFFPTDGAATYPAYLDTSSDYANGTEIGSVHNPLGSWANEYGKERPRGAYPLTSITQNAAGYTTPNTLINFTVFEPLLLPLLHDRPGEGLALTGVQTITLNLQLRGPFSRIWSHSTASPYDNSGANTVSVLAGFSSQPVLHMRYSTPPQGYVPRPLNYRADLMLGYSTPTATALTTGNTITGFATNAIMLGSIPRHIYIWVRENDTSATPQSADWALTLTQLSIQLGNIPNQLANAKGADLYALSRANGLKDTWEQWSGASTGPGSGGNGHTSVGTTGSFMCIDVAKDLTLEAGQFVGAVTSTNLVVTLNVANNTPTTMANPTVWVILETPQYWTCYEGNTTQILGLGESVAAGAGATGGEVTYLPYSAVSDAHGAGFRDFFAKFMSFAKPMMGALRESGIVSKGLKALGHEKVGNFAENFGFGGAVVSRADMVEKLRRM